MSRQTTPKLTTQPTRTPPTLISQQHHIPHRRCGSPQIVEGLRLRGVRDGRRGGLLVIDR